MTDAKFSMTNFQSYQPLKTSPNAQMHQEGQMRPEALPSATATS
jgi:hypothetical protein